jgi:hypothetical protein
MLMTAYLRGTRGTQVRIGAGFWISMRLSALLPEEQNGKPFIGIGEVLDR